MFPWPSLPAGFEPSPRPSLPAGFELSPRPSLPAGFGPSPRPSLPAGFELSPRPSLPAGRDFGPVRTSGAFPPTAARRAPHEATGGYAVRSPCPSGIPRPRHNADLPWAAGIAPVLAFWLHRFASLGLKSRIDAAVGPVSEQSLQRFPISAPELAITAAPDPFHWISLQPKGVRHGAAAGECRMGRDFGRRSRPWLREREGPAAQRWEGKHRRCAPVRSPCPQADSDAETRSLPAGRLGRVNASLSPSGCLIC